MTIEFFTFVVTIFTVLISALATIVSESPKWKRRLAIATVILGLVAAFTLLESNERTRAKDRIASDVERDWILLSSSDVLGWQFELVVDGGFLYLKEALAFLQGMKFTIDGASAPGLPDLAQGSPLSSVFTVENISKSGLIGDPAPIFGKDEHGDAVPVDSECVASGYRSRVILGDLPKFEAAHKDPVVCSIRVSIIPSQPSPSLTDLLKSRQISLTMPENPPRCAGACRAIIIGIRAIVTPPNTVTEPLVEISPMVLSHAATSASAGVVTFRASGDALLDLAKSFYKETSGYADITNFPLTTGLLHWMYVKATKGTQLVTRRDQVWATTSSDAVLRKRLDPSIRDRVILLELPDWCGFGDSAFCWRRFWAELTTAK